MDANLQSLTNEQLLSQYETAVTSRHSREPVMAPLIGPLPPMPDEQENALRQEIIKRMTSAKQ